MAVLLPPASCLLPPTAGGRRQEAGGRRQEAGGRKEELKAFTLEVTVIPSSYPKYSHCFLEQFYLLNNKFNLNTHKIVNFRVNQGFNIYLYDKDCKILYYSSNSLNAFCADLGIHHSSYKKHIANNSLFLDHFIISNNLIPEATISDLTELELRELIDEPRKTSLNKVHLSYGKPVEVLDSDTNTTKIYDSSYKVVAPQLDLVLVEVL